MDCEDYQRKAERTSPWKGCVFDPNVPQAHTAVVAARERIIAAAMGLAGESGEFCDALKKTLFHEHEFDRMALSEELGDVAWYLAEAASALGLDLGAIFVEQQQKARERYPDGWSAERSKNRSKP